MSDKNYRMSKEAKRMLAIMPKGVARNAVKKLFIDSEVFYEQNKRKSAKSRERTED